MEVSGEKLAPSAGLKQCATGILAVIFVVSPLKFAGSVSTHVFSNYPLDVIQFILTPWPVTWVPVVSVLALVAVLAVNGMPSTAFFRKTWMVWVAPAITFMVCWVGWLGTDNLLQPISFTVHMAGIVVFTLALLIHLAYCPGSRKILIGAFAAGIVLLCLFAAYEYFWSFKFTLVQLEKMIEEHGPGSVDPQILSRLRQNRPQAGFPISNSLGGHLVLVTPFLVALMYQVGKTIDPPHVSKVLLPVLVGGVLGFFIYTTKSRGATFSLMTALVVCGAMVALKHKEHVRRHRLYYVMGVLGLPIIGVLAYLAIRDGRSFSSVGARLTYWSNGWDMFTDHPLRGNGIGEFFYHYVSMKPEGAETARLPHSMFIFFASSCGITGILAVAAYLMTPFSLVKSFISDRLKPISPVMFWGALTGVIAWLLHSQTDFNIHIPASLMALSACLLLSIEFSPEEKAEQFAWLPFSLIVCVAAVAGASSLRFPGDFYLAKLDKNIQLRRETTPAAVPIETLMVLAESGTQWSPGSFLFWERIGAEAMNEKRYDIAVKAYQTVTAINPHYAAGHFRLSNALAKMQRLPEAREAFNAGVKWNANPTKYDDLRAYLFAEPGTQTDAPSPKDSE